MVQQTQSTPASSGFQTRNRAFRAGPPGDLLLRDLGMTLVRGVGAGIGGALLLACIVFMLADPAQAAVEASASADALETPRSGRLWIGTLPGGAVRDAPLLATEVEMHISGMLARVAVRQRFRNPGDDWAEGIYAFPLPENAAVDRMRLRVAERLIEGEIRERKQARELYAAAKSSGRRAALLDQERPNLFTTSVANIGPGETISVEIEYQQILRYEAGRFHLRFPLVVGPRYIPGLAEPDALEPGFAGSGWALGTAQVPDASRITPLLAEPAAGPRNPVQIRVILDAGFPLLRLDSRYHPVEVVRDGQGRHHIELARSAVAADRDFELVWTPALGAEPQGALFNESWAGEHYALLMVLPPTQAQVARSAGPRELVFVVDTSGSMHGASLREAISALRLALQRLAPGDRFNLIQFNDRAEALFDASLPASDANRRRALAYLDRLSSGGGTEMLPALELALGRGAAPGMLRQVVFLTDGSVGNEAELFAYIRGNLGPSRLFTIGIGSAPNSHFMTRAAAAGRGTFTYIGKPEEVAERMNGLLRKLERPALTDIRIQVPGPGETEIWPRPVPDLYAGEPVLITLRKPQPGGAIRLSGDYAGVPWERRLRLSGGKTSPGVHALWARDKIASLMEKSFSGAAEDPQGVRDKVVEVALRHRMVSKYTSLVALDRTPVRPPGEGLRSAPVPLNLPHGWSAEKVFGVLPQTASDAGMHGMLGASGLLAVWLLRRRRGNRRRSRG